MGMPMISVLAFVVAALACSSACHSLALGDLRSHIPGYDG